MRNCEFPEKTYEIFLDHELMTKYNFELMIPSQNQEKQLGFDVCLNKMHTKLFKFILLQYKIPKQYSNCPKKYPSCLGETPYMFYLHGNKYAQYPTICSFDQHNYLVNFNINGVPAFYCLPRFLDYDNLYKNLSTQSIFDNSILLKPVYSVPNAPEHKIIYNNSVAYQFSEDGHKVELHTTPEFMNILANQKYMNYNEWNECMEKTFKELPNENRQHSAKYYLATLSKNNIMPAIQFK